jgi:glucose-1-phosphate cytidylyltransferase
MKTVILAGGFGTRLSEETADKPKPMVEIGGYPMLWHLLTFYAGHGHREFVIACGYLGEVIKQYFCDMSVHAANWTADPRSGQRQMVNQVTRDWNVRVVDTGRDTMTGGRLHRLRAMLDGETFMCTYGDGLSDVDVPALLAFHRAHGKLATVTAVHPPARFGAITLDGSSVTLFSEKPQASEGWINGGFFVFEPGVLSHLDGDNVSLERGPLNRLAADGQLCAYRHEGFWQPMDTLREKTMLEVRWQRGDAPWLPASHSAPR